MEGIPGIDESRVRMWQPPEPANSGLPNDSEYKLSNIRIETPESTNAEQLHQLEQQAAAAKNFHNDGMTAEQRKAAHYKSLTFCGKLVWVSCMPVVWVTGHVNIKAQWMVMNSNNVASFITTHLKGPVTPWRLRDRRNKCRSCEFSDGKWCNASQCNCGKTKVSRLKHTTRLSGIACPKGKWGHGLIHRAIAWCANRLAQRKDL